MSWNVSFLLTIVRIGKKSQAHAICCSLVAVICQEESPQFRTACQWEAGFCSAELTASLQGGWWKRTHWRPVTEKGVHSGVSACRLAVARFQTHPVCALSEETGPFLTVLSLLFQSSWKCEVVRIHFARQRFFILLQKRPTLEGQIKSFLSLFNGIWMNRVKYALCIHW